MLFAMENENQLNKPKSLRGQTIFFWYFFHYTIGIGDVCFECFETFPITGANSKTQSLMAS